MPAEAPAITRLDPADDDTVRAMYEVHNAARLADDAGEPPTSVTEFRARRSLAPPLAPPSECWYIPGGATPLSAPMAGWYWLKLPDMENRDRAELAITVHPAARRQGLGSALLRHAASRARANGRAVLDCDLPQGSPSEAFARQAGATFGLAALRRTLDLQAVPASHFAQCREKAATAAAGYSLVQWTGPTPDKYVKGVAELFTTMNDAPDRPEAEPDIWDEDRVRLRLDKRMEALGSRYYMLAALHDAAGEMAALSELRVDPDEPGWGSQGNTVVARRHRGHRLGLLVKAAMLEWLAEQEPRLARITTWNSAVNQHMIAINEELGFRVSSAPHLETGLRVADVIGPEGA